MNIPKYIKESSKVIGYFAYTPPNHAYCDADACIITGSELLMKHYLQKGPDEVEQYIIKKTRFGEIIEGVRRGGAYAFDEEAYGRFISCAKTNAIDGLPEKNIFLRSPTHVSDMHFIRIQMVR